MASSPKEKPWTRLVPFTRSWNDRRNARKQDAVTGTAATPIAVVPNHDAVNDASTNAVVPNLDAVNDVSSEGHENIPEGGPAEMAGIAAAKRQQMVSPTLAPSVNKLSSPRAEDLDGSGGAREVVQCKTPMILPSSASSAQQTPQLQQTPPPPAPAMKPQRRAATAPLTQTTTAIQSRAATKSVAQYGHHDNKGAVGWTAPSPSPHRPYPYRQTVNGHRVLAQYGHNTDKWAVKHSVY